MQHLPRPQSEGRAPLLASNPLPTASWPFCEVQQQQWPQGRGQALLDQAQAAAERLSDRSRRRRRQAAPALLSPPWLQSDAAALLPAAVLLPLLPQTVGPQTTPQGRVSASATCPAAPSRAPAACPDPPPAQWTECSRRRQLAGTELPLCLCRCLGTALCQRQLSFRSPGCGKGAAAGDGHRAAQ